MPTVGDGGVYSFWQNKGPLWKIHWDAVLAVAYEELARAKGNESEIPRWPSGQHFIDIWTTTPKSHGVYRVFRTYKNGAVELGRVTQNGEVEIIQPNEIELTGTHIEDYRRKLSAQLGSTRP